MKLGRRETWNLLTNYADHEAKRSLFIDPRRLFGLYGISNPFSVGGRIATEPM
ncbi:hypothetical protein B0J17DRAFT_673224, partial [Rhizoctonia solani]